MTLSGNKRNQSSVTFAVDGIATGGAYASGDNHDPDGDSDGSAIVILAP